MSIRVVGSEVAVDEAVVDGLVNERRQPLLVIKLYNFINPKDGCDRRGRSLGNECGKIKMVADANQPVRPNERVAGSYV